MRLPLATAGVDELLALLALLEAQGRCPVLVGGLVPPLLVAALALGRDPEPEPRQTRDCDVAFAVDDDDPDDLDQLMRELGFEHRVQFRWQHARTKLKLDAIPVHRGVERGDPLPVAWSRRLQLDDPRRFFHGYELALAQPLTVEVEHGGARPRVRIAGLAAMLAMKLQAWRDRRFDRTRDAADVVWLLRNLKPSIVVDGLAAVVAERPTLTDQVIERLAADFCDPWGRGVTDYYKEQFGWSETHEEARRAAAARAAAAVVAAARALGLGSSSASIG
jgi:hypothetical protein